MLHHRAPVASEPLALELPRRDEAPGDGPRQERPEALAEPRARGILGRRHADVMAAVVLDEEVAVPALGERDLAQPALEPVALVPELVRGVDRDPAHHRLGQRQPHLVDDGQVAARPQPAREHEPGVLERQERVRAPAVVAVLLEPLEHAVRRVLGVEADQQIERREHAEDQDRPPEPEEPQAGEVHQPVDDERQRRHNHPEQPRVALAVPPRRRSSIWRARPSAGGAVLSPCHRGHPRLLQVPDRQALHTARSVKSADARSRVDAIGPG